MRRGIKRAIAVALCAAMCMSTVNPTAVTAYAQTDTVAESAETVDGESVQVENPGQESSDADTEMASEEKAGEDDVTENATEEQTEAEVTSEDVTTETTEESNTEEIVEPETEDAATEETTEEVTEQGTEESDAELAELKDDTVYETEDGAYQYQIQSDDTIIIKSYIGSDAAVVIPDTIDERQVTAIGSKAFYAKKITSVRLSDSVKSIETSAFRDCSELKEVDLNKVETIGSYAFEDDTAIESIVLPETLKNVGRNVFYGSTKLTDITVRADIESNADQIFNGAPAKNITFGSECTKVPAKMFWGTGVEKITLPDNIKTIEGSAFRNCSELKEVDLNKVETIGNYAFEDDTAIESIVLPETLKNVGSNVFNGCTALTDITVSADIESDANHMFSGAPAKNITFGSACTKVPGGMFYYTGVEKITLPDNIKTIEDSAFRNCSELKEVDLNKVETIGNYVFEEDPGLTRIVFPKSLKKIGSDIFWRTEGIEYVEIYSENLNANSGSPVFGFSKSIKMVTIGEGVESLPKGLFIKSNVKTVCVNADNMTFDSCAFSECDELGDVIFAGRHYTFADENVFFSSPGVVLNAGAHSSVIPYAVDNNIKYKLTSEDLTDSYLNFDKTKLTISSYSKLANYTEFQIDYAFKDAGTDLGNAVVKFRMGDGVKLLEADAVMADGIAVQGYTLKDGILTIPVTKTASTIKVRVNTAEQLGSVSMYAQISSDTLPYDEMIGVLMTGSEPVTVAVDPKTSKKTVSVKGTAPKDQTVDIYVNGEQVKSGIKANKLGCYNTEIELDNPTSGAKYKITAKITLNGEMYESSATVQYDENAAELTRFDYYYYTIHKGVRKIDLLNCNDNVIIYSAPSHGYQFAVNFDNRNGIDEVYVVSTKNDEVKYVKLDWDEAQGCYYSDKYFDDDRSYVPGALTVFYTDKVEKIDLSIPESQYEQAAEKLLPGKENMPEVFKNATHEIVANDSDHFEINIISEDGTKMTFGVQNIYDDKDVAFVAGENNSTIKELIVTYGTAIAEGVYVYDPEDGKDYYIYDVVKDSVVKCTIDNVAEMLHLPDNFSDLNKEISEGKLDSMIKFWIQTKSNLGSTEVNAAFSVADFYIDYLTEYKKIYSGNYSDEEKARLYAELDERGTRELAHIGVTCAMEFAKDAGIKMVIGGNAWGVVLWTAATVIEDYSEWKHNHPGGTPGDYLDEKLKNLKHLIDPSGLVYEGVTTNYLDGVTATLYYQDQDGNAVPWDAENYEQINPIITDIDGSYAWDVPEGKWQVKFEKEGYQTAYSEWMDVPPERTDVNVTMIANAAPEVGNLIMEQMKIKMTFTQYMDPDTVKNIVLMAGDGSKIDYELQYSQDETDKDGKVYAKSFTCNLKDYKAKKGETITVSVPATVKNYSGKAFVAANLTIKADNPASIRTTDKVNIAVNDTVKVPVAIDNYTGKETFAVTNSNDYAVSVKQSDVNVTDKTAALELEITGIMKGKSDVTLTLDNGTDPVVIAVTVDEKSDDKIDIPSYVEPEWDDDADDTECSHAYKVASIKKATFTASGYILSKCSKCTETKKVVLRSPAKPKLGKTAFVYNGKAQKPAVKVTKVTGKTIEAKYYKLTYYKDVTNVGKKWVKITFKSDCPYYSGSYLLYYTVIPKNTSAFLVSGAKKSVNARWMAQKTQTTGYEIQFSTAPTFKYIHTIKVSSNKQTTTVIKNLKSKRTYYVRMRTYKAVGKVRYYSSWTHTRKVTTK